MLLFDPAPVCWCHEFTSAASRACSASSHQHGFVEHRVHGPRTQRPPSRAAPRQAPGEGAAPHAPTPARSRPRGNAHRLEGPRTAPTRFEGQHRRTGPPRTSRSWTATPTRASRVRTWNSEDTSAGAAPLSSSALGVYLPAVARSLRDGKPAGNLFDRNGCVGFEGRPSRFASTAGQGTDVRREGSILPGWRGVASPREHYARRVPTARTASRPAERMRPLPELLTCVTDARPRPVSGATNPLLVCLVVGLGLVEGLGGLVRTVCGSPRLSPVFSLPTRRHT